MGGLATCVFGVFGLIVFVVLQHRFTVYFVLGCWQLLLDFVWILIVLCLLFGFRFELCGFLF